jgi:hypothetical protein
VNQPISQVKFLAGEHRDNARMKRRKAEILCAEAAMLEECADRIERAIEVDAKRMPAPSAPAEPK